MATNSAARGSQGPVRKRASGGADAGTGNGDGGVTTATCLPPQPIKSTAKTNATLSIPVVAIFIVRCWSPFVLLPLRPSQTGVAQLTATWPWTVADVLNITALRIVWA